MKSSLNFFNSLSNLGILNSLVLGHFGHGHFGLDISDTDVSAMENPEGGRFSHNHKSGVWDVCMHECVMHFIIL